jgi:hypothetical protein
MIDGIQQNNTFTTSMLSSSAADPRMFLDFLDPDPSIIKEKNSKKNFDSYGFAFEKMTEMYLSKYRYRTVKSSKTLGKKIVFCWCLEGQ